MNQPIAANPSAPAAEAARPIYVRVPGNTGLLSLIALLLVLLVAGNVYTLVTGYQQQQIQAERAASYQARVAAIGKLADGQRALGLDLYTSYRKDAYGNASIDRIAEQLLLASEYNLQALQLLATQNSEIIELLSAAP